MLFKNVNDFAFLAQNVKLVNERTSSVTSIFAAFKPASVLKDTLAEAQRLVGLPHGRNEWDPGPHIY